VSGKTTHLSAVGALPARNVPVVRLRRPLPAVIDPGAVAAELRGSAERHDVDLSGPVALSFAWAGQVSYQRLAALAAAIKDAAGEGDGLLVVVVDADLAQALGAVLKEETGLGRELIALDGIDLAELDYIDIGGHLNPPGVVPVVIKSLLFAGPESEPGQP
jgi:ethanolamine utilization protein EutA